MDDKMIRAAIYARVSSDQQAKACTIASQMAALKERIEEDGLALEDELCFIDDGYVGGTLVRPALERLRDVAYAGGIDRLYVHSPDRLSMPTPIRTGSEGEGLAGHMTINSFG